MMFANSVYRATTSPSGSGKITIRFGIERLDAMKREYGIECLFNHDFKSRTSKRSGLFRCSFLEPMEIAHVVFGVEADLMPIDKTSGHHRGPDNPSFDFPMPVSKGEAACRIVIA